MRCIHDLKYFDVQIPDSEAEKIRTVQEMIDCISTHLSISENGLNLKIKLFENFKSLLLKSGITHELALSDTIFDLINPNEKEIWDKISETLNLELPKPIINSNKIFNKILKAFNIQPDIDLNKITVDQFIDAIYANNYKKIIDQKCIKTKYEIFIVIKAIISENIGINLYEIQTNKNFVNDFGIS